MPFFTMKNRFLAGNVTSVCRNVPRSEKFCDLQVAGCIGCQGLNVKVVGASRAFRDWGGGGLGAFGCSVAEGRSAGIDSVGAEAGGRELLT